MFGHKDVNFHRSPMYVVDKNYQRKKIKSQKAIPYQKIEPGRENQLNTYKPLQLCQKGALLMCSQLIN